jgi:chromosome segregation ATPase
MNMSSSPAMDKFAELEERIVRTTEVFKTTKSENDRIRKELAAALAQNSRLEHELGELRQERELVKNKVESLLDNLSELTEGSLV